MVERARACYKRKLDEDPSYKCLTRLQVGWAVAGAYPLRTPPRFVQVVVVKGDGNCANIHPILSRNRPYEY